MEKNPLGLLRKESFNRTEDTAQENSSINDPEFKRVYRNELFDRIVATGMEFYVALLIDYPSVDFLPPEGPLQKLFCGNVGEINNVIMEEAHKDCYAVSFNDYPNNEEEFTERIVNKKHLLPLFCFDPATYERIITKPKEENEILLKGNISINSIRDMWETLNIDIISNNTLKRHKKVETRFQVGELVTIQFDFKQKSENESVTIQAGQVGIISKTQNLETDCVEVTFFAMSFGEVVYERKKLISSSLYQDSPLYADSSWERKICIHKDFLFPLYTEKLQ